MRDYGRIESAFWLAPDHRPLSDGAKLLACLLLTGPHSNGLGCFAMGDGAVYDLLGWSPETIAERFGELSRNGFANRLEGVVFIPHFLRWNRIINRNIAVGRFREWEQLPKGQAKAHAARAMLSFYEGWNDAHRRRLEMVSQMVAQTVTQEVCQPKNKNKSKNKNKNTANVTASGGDNPPEKNEAPPPITPQHVVDLFNEVMPPHMPRVEKITPGRKHHLTARIREDLPTLDSWRAYLLDVKRNPFLLGGGKPRHPGEKPWRATFDWLIQPGNFAKVLEGNYG